MVPWRIGSLLQSQEVCWKYLELVQQPWKCCRRMESQPPINCLPNFLVSKTKVRISLDRTYSLSLGLHLFESPSCSLMGILNIFPRFNFLSIFLSLLVLISLYFYYGSLIVLPITHCTLSHTYDLLIKHNPPFFSHLTRHLHSNPNPNPPLLYPSLPS